MRIAVGSDHAGFELKEKVRRALAFRGIEVEDFGTSSLERVDYPDYAGKVAAAVRDGRADRGVLVCGTGIGVCIVANKFRGIRAAAPWDADTTRLSRAHNDTNILCLSGRHMDHAAALELLAIWLDTPFDGGRHQLRIDRIGALEKGEGEG